jgi:hypothetical protein
MRMSSHLVLMLLFALALSVLFGGLMRGSPNDRMRYALRSFATFVVVGIAIAWLMYPFSH